MAKNKGGNFWSHFEAVLLQIAYIPLLLTCFNSKSAKFLLCLFIHCIQIMCWLLSIDFYIALKIVMLFLDFGLYEVFSSECIALHCVLYFNL